MSRVLVGFIWDGKSGGIDAYLMAFADVARSQGVSLDFLTNEFSPGLARTLADMGHGLFEIATLRNQAEQRATILALENENRYDAAYFNISTALLYPVVKAARDAGIPQVIVHAHAAGNDQPSHLRQLAFDAANAVLRRPLRRAATDLAACSRSAARWLFGAAGAEGGEVLIVPNPIDVRACAFDAATRAAVREEMGLAGKTVVGSVTAFKSIKNPLFLVDVFAAYLKRRPESVLLAVGDGELAEEVRSYAAAKLPSDSYKLLGKRADVPALLQAFDVFVLPSRKEGLSIATIEAQTAGLPCLISDGVPEEAAVVPGLVARLPLSYGDASWAEVLDELSRKAESSVREDRSRDVEAAGYVPDSPRAILQMLK